MCEKEEDVDSSEDILHVVIPGRGSAHVRILNDSSRSGDGSLTGLEFAGAQPFLRLA